MRKGAPELQAILRKAFPAEKGEELINYFKRDIQRFEGLRKLSAKQVALLIEQESLQVIACILSYLKPEVAAEVLVQLPLGSTSDLLVRIANLGEISSVWLDELDDFFDRIPPDIFTPQKIGGVDSLVKMIQTMGEKDQKKQLELLGSRDPELAELVQRGLFGFSDLTGLSDHEMQALIRSTSLEDWALALRGAPTELQEACFRNVSKRVAEELRSRLAHDPPSPKHKIEEAQQRILQLRSKSN